ncbi:phosphoribosyltransferase [Arthrobacter sp. SDTb3-6]|uniref:phosphoribosyltransferase n=1 Tax=Arthrobacter sp. SDTb3-6 TaxID=2713571 RepID=UPI00159D53DF|nr:phosphoribosyltransferase family protein [Arthrobacter sp. SDTb3-6]NVM98613.1 phosphoribosyl transferase [Arthrobacter sp. SDTb3-6]
MDYTAEPKPWQPFLDRDDAGTRLGRALLEAPGGKGLDRPLVLGLARGGVPVAAGVARALGVPLGVLVVRKLGVPGSPEVAFGAVATYAGAAAAVHLEQTVHELRRHGYGARELEQVEQEERAELARRQALYAPETQDPAAGRTVLLCDDGLATGATMRAAVTLMRNAGAAEVLACIPAAPEKVCAELLTVADRVACLQPWPGLRAVSEAYLRFGQLGDAGVLALLGGW